MSMMGDEIAISKGQSVRQYASAVFSDTLVTGVPNIVNTHYWPRKIFKTTVLLLCIVGFLYQTIEFLTLVYSYPSIVDISVYTPKEYLFPAIDICNNNGIVRSKFCQKFPERCETPENKSEFCDENPHYFQYCKNETEWNKLKVPKEEFYYYGANASLNALKELTHDKELMFHQASMSYEGRLDVNGPLIFFKNSVQYISCYTIHLRANNNMDPIRIPMHPLSTLLPAMQLTIDFELNETFMPGRKPEGILAIHSPFDVVNPFQYGIRIKPKKIYNVHIKMTEEELLPLPYESDCINYTQEWLDAGKEGPRSQEMCKLICLHEAITKSCNCTGKFLSYPYEEDVCFTDELTCFDSEAQTELVLCLTLCKDDCEKQKFSTVVEERVVEEADWEKKEDKEQRKSYVYLYLSDPEVVVYRHRPRYETVEVFGYIGGYSGVWLGISLVAVIDFIECLFLIASFAFRRK